MSEGATVTGAGRRGELFEPEHTDYRESFRTFLAREVVPAQDEWRAAGAVPRDVLRAAGEHGYLGMRVPEAHGGAGVEDPRFGVVLGEECMRAGVAALALLLAGHNDVALPAILRGAGEEAQAAWLPGLASGEALAAVAHGDIALDAGGETARLQGTAHFVVGAAQADLIVVVSSDAQDEPVLAVVERDAPGVRIEAAEPPIGLAAAGFANVLLDDAAGVLLDERAERLHADEALALAVTALAGARRALAVTLEYVRERRVFGQPVAAFQNTRRVLAALSADIEVGAEFVSACVARQVSDTLDPVAAASARLFCGELYARAVDAGVQLHGGYGYIMEYEIAHAFADARFWRLHGAGDEAATDVIARELLG